MDWNFLYGLLFAVGVLAPVFWVIWHFRELDPNIPVREIPKPTRPKTKLEEIFGM